MYSKDLERMVRTLQRQRCTPDYIRHYLQENYLLTNAVIDQVFETCGVDKPKRSSGAKSVNELLGGKPVEKPGKVKRSDYY